MLNEIIVIKGKRYVVPDRFGIDLCGSAWRATDVVYIVFDDDITPDLRLNLRFDQSHSAMNNELNIKILAHWEKYNIPPIPKECLDF